MKSLKSRTPRLLVDILFMLGLVLLAVVMGCTTARVALFDGDFSSAFYAWQRYTKSFADGALTLWDSQVWGGTTAIAHAYQPLYPVTLLLGLLFYSPENRLVSTDIYFVFLCVHMAILALGMYLLLRVNHYGCVASAIAAAGTAFSGGILFFAWPFLYAAYSLIPLVILFASLYCAKQGPVAWIYAVCTGVTFSFISLAGYVSGIMLGVVVFAILLLCMMWQSRRDRRELLRLTGLSAVAGGIGAGLAAIQLIPIFEFAAHSVRYVPGEGFLPSAQPYSYNSFIAHPAPVESVASLIRGGQGFLAGGIVLFVLAALGFFSKRQNGLLSFARCCLSFHCSPLWELCFRRYFTASPASPSFASCFCTRPSFSSPKGCWPPKGCKPCGTA